MLSAIGRTLVTFLLGAVVGAVGTGWLFYSGAGDVVLRRGSVVQDLERRLDEVEAQRDQLGRSLEDVIRRAEESESRFRGLEQRLQSLLAAAEGAKAPSEPSPSGPGGGEAQGQ